MKMVKNIKNNNQDDISPEDIDKLLSGHSSKETSNAEDISQKDIDNLLKGIAEDEKTRKLEDKISDTKPIFISQDKINQLLKNFEKNQPCMEISPDATGEKDEQVSPKTLKSEINDHGKVSSQNNIENLLSDFDDSGMGTEKTVIKERADGKQWLQSKRGIIFSAVAVVILLSSLFTYIAFNQTPKNSLKQTTEKATSDFVKPIPPVPGLAEKNFSVDFKNFIVLAPVSRKDFAFITADVRIDFINDLTANEINKNRSFSRYVIYNVLKSELISRDNTSIGITNLKGSIARALKKSLPEMPEKGIKKVIFKRFDLI